MTAIWWLKKDLKAYADTLLPYVNDDFIGTAKGVLTQKKCEGLRK